MENQIKYISISEQLSLLAAKGLSFKDKNIAAKMLETYGYYNIINSYKSPYLIKDNGESNYLEGTTFEQIFSLFTFDHNLRNSIMAAMLDLEERVKSAAADVIAESFGTNQMNYLKWNNYRDRHVTHDRFGLNGILNTLQKNLDSDKNPIKYYREKYGIIPPWILFKGTYFSTVVNLTRLFKNQQKQLFVKKMYDCSNITCISKSIIDILFSTLFVSLEYRNLAAHGGRVYNYIPEYNIQFQCDEFLNALYPYFSEYKFKQGISQFLMLLHILEYKKPFEIICDTITKELERHLTLYPEDYRILGNTMGINIYMEQQDSIIKNGNQYPMTTIHQSDDSSVVLIENIPDELKSLFIKNNI